MGNRGRHLKSPQQSVVQQVVMRSSTSLADPSMYLKVLGNETEEPQQVLLPPVPKASVEPTPTIVEEKATEPVQATPAKITRQKETWLGMQAGISSLVLGEATHTAFDHESSGLIIPSGTGPLARVMQAICPQCADAVIAHWNGFLRLADEMEMSKNDVCFLETAIARMTKNEQVVRPSSNHTDYYYRVLQAVTPLDEIAASASINTLIECEKIGLQFTSGSVYQKFFEGLKRRIGQELKTDEEYDLFAKRMSRQLFPLLAKHLAHLSPEERSLVSTDVLLMGLDLYAHSEGSIPLCKCLRVAIWGFKRGLARETIFMAGKVFATRIDELSELLKYPLIPDDAYEYMLLYPIVIEHRTLSDIKALFVRWKNAGSPSNFARFLTHTAC